MGVDLVFYKTINLLPIRAASFVDNLHLEQTDFFLLEAESNYKISPVTRQIYLGGNVTLGYNAEVNLYVPINFFNWYNSSMMIRLEKLKGRTINSKLVLGNYEPTDSGWSNPPDEIGDFTFPLNENTQTKIINATDKMIIDFGNNLTFNYEIEGVEYRPRVIIHLSGFIKSTINISAYGEDIPEGIQRMMFK